MNNLEESVSLDFLMLANHVENVNGLLYVSGGGWTDHHRQVVVGNPAPLSHMGIAASVTVPWTQTNRPHSIAIRVEDEDGNLIGKVDGQLNVGRPPLLPPGAVQPMMIGFALDLQFPHAGGYRLVAQVDDGEAKSWPFRVHDVPAMRPAA
jgi:hypothetical protein